LLPNSAAVRWAASEQDAEFMHVGNLNDATVRQTWTASEHSDFFLLCIYRIGAMTADSSRGSSSAGCQSDSFCS